MYCACVCVWAPVFVHSMSVIVFLFFMCGCRDAKPLTFFRIQFSLFSVVSLMLCSSYIFLRFPLLPSASSFPIFFRFVFFSSNYFSLWALCSCVCVFISFCKRTQNNQQLSTNIQKSHSNTHICTLYTFCHIFAKYNLQKTIPRKKNFKWQKRRMS